MREAMGGTWLFGIVITFIALFAGFLAYSVSYTKAFNMKNEILNVIERNEGYTYYDGDVTNVGDEELKNDESVEAQVFYKIKKAGYNYTSASAIDCRSVGHVDSTPKTGGYCVTKYCKEGAEDTYVYYKVTTFIAVKLPVVNITLKVPITGETKTLYYDYGYTCEGKITE